MRLLNDTRIRVLIVDDEVGTLKLLALMCQRIGCDCWTAHDGEESLELAEQVQPHIILMDTMMPRMHGIEATRRLRDMRSLDRTAIILCTVSTSADTIMEAMDAGANDVLIKPFLPTDLYEKINVWSWTIPIAEAWESVPLDKRFDHFFSYAVHDEDIRVRVLIAEGLIGIATTPEQRAQMIGLLSMWTNDIDPDLVSAAQRLRRQLPD